MRCLLVFALFVAVASAAPNWQSDLELEKKYEDAMKRNADHFSNELMERGWFSNIWNKVKESDLFKKVKDGAKKWAGGLLSKLSGAANGGGEKRELEEQFEVSKRDMQDVFEQIFRREMEEDFDLETFKREMETLDARGFFGN